MIYSLSRTGTATTSGNALFDVCSPTASGARARVMELAVFLGAATASTYAVNRPTAIGTRTSPVALLAEDPADPALSSTLLVDAAIAWSAQPTLASADLRAVALPATIGTGMVWTFPKGLVVATQGSIAIVNRATNAASAPCHAVCDI